MSVPGFSTVVVPVGTTLWHATRASFLGLPTSPRGDRPAWFGLGEAETRWYAESSWKEGGTPRIIQAITTHELALPNVAGSYAPFAMAFGVPVTPEALFTALRQYGMCGWAVAPRSGLDDTSALAIVDPHRCGIRFVRSTPLGGLRAAPRRAMFQVLR